MTDTTYPPIAAKWIYTRGNTACVMYGGLLDAAHARGLTSIKTTLVQIPSDSNGYTAIVHATAATETLTCDGIGDADPGNAGKIAQLALIRMAETRAKARALRDLVNVGDLALDELPQDEPARPPRPPSTPPRPPAPPARPATTRIARDPSYGG